MTGDLSDSGFSRADDALIGRCVRAFGSLEHTLGSLLRCLYLLKPEAHGCECDNAAWKKVRLQWRSLASMATSLSEEITSNADCSLDTKAIYEKLIRVLKDIATLRNSMAHGHWRIEADDGFSIEYWDVGALKELDFASATQRKDPGCAIQNYQFSRDALIGGIDYVLRVSGEIAALEKAIRDTALDTGVTLAADVGTNPKGRA